MTVCNVKEVACSDKPVGFLAAALLSRFSLTAFIGVSDAAEDCFLR